MIRFFFCIKWKLGKNPSPRQDSNPQPSVVESDALTTELLNTRLVSSYIVKPGQERMTHNCITQSHEGISQIQPSNHKVSLLKKKNMTRSPLLAIEYPWPIAQQPAQQAFLCGLGAKNEERESKTARQMALVSFLARSKPKIPFLGLSLLRNLTETLATQARNSVVRASNQITQGQGLGFESHMGLGFFPSFHLMKTTLPCSSSSTGSLGSGGVA